MARTSMHAGTNLNLNQRTRTRTTKPVQNRVTRAFQRFALRSSDRLRCNSVRRLLQAMTEKPYKSITYVYLGPKSRNGPPRLYAGWGGGEGVSPHSPKKIFKKSAVKPHPGKTAWQ